MDHFLVTPSFLPKDLPGVLLPGESIDRRGLAFRLGSVLGLGAEALAIGGFGLRWRRG